METLFVCNKREKYIANLQKHLSKENKKVKILQINGFKLYENEKDYKEIPPRGFSALLNKIPKLKVLSKIAHIKNILSKNEYENIVFFYNDWTIKYLLPSLLKSSKKLFFHIDSPSQFKGLKEAFKKANALIFSDPQTKEEFEKIYKREFLEKSFICRKGVEFKPVKTVKNEEKKGIYCDILAVKNIKEFVNSLDKNSFYIFPMLKESFERRKELKEILKESGLNYKISNSFLTEEENLSLIANSEFIIALTDPKYSQTIQHALYLKKICIIYENFTKFFDEKEFHFVTIKKLKELGKIRERIGEYEKYKNENAKNVYALFSFENIVKTCEKILEKR